MICKNCKQPIRKTRVGIYPYRHIGPGVEGEGYWYCANHRNNTDQSEGPHAEPLPESELVTLILSVYEI